MTAVSSATPHRLRLLRHRLLGWRPTLRWARDVLRSFVTSFLALGVTFWVLPGEQTDGFWSVAALALGVLAIGALLRPFLVQLTVLTGVVGLLLTGVLAQALILAIALSVVPSLKPFSVTDIFLAAWGATVVAAVVNWLFDASSEDAYLGQLLGQAVRMTHRSPSAGPGLLVVQLDGVSEPLLRQAMTAGAMPCVSRMLRDGTHQLRRWNTGLPATTPAGQAVLLHGDTRHVPSFRWFDKHQQRMLAASKPADLQQVEKLLSTGRGLLAHDGVSVANLFSGDAPTRVLTMSDARLPTRERGVARFVGAGNGFARSVVLLAGQVVTEWFQARRQRLRDVRPRVSRTGAFLILRGLTSVVLRDLCLSIVTEHMARGRPVIYVDLMDYDEVAHHAGPSRQESMRTLEGLDRAIQYFADLAAEVTRDYEIVLVSDHGQSQGVTFRQQVGRTLQDVVHQLASEEHPDAVSAHRGGRSAEAWTPANVLIAGAARSGHVVGAAARSAERRAARAQQVPLTERLVVAASGSLAHVYLADVPGVLTGQQVAAAYPLLIDGLAACPGIGAVITRDAGGALHARGPHGSCRVDATGEHAVRGRSPLAPYGADVADDLFQLSRREHAGDVIVLGSFDSRLGEVTAFEELVGSHGGAGGWQTRALFIHPTGWEVPGGVLSGTQVHRAMLARLGRLGLRPGDSDPAEMTT